MSFKKIIGYFLFIIYSPFLNAVLFFMFVFGKDRYVRANTKFLLDLKGDGFTDKELADAGFIETTKGIWTLIKNEWVIKRSDTSWVLSNGIPESSINPRNIEELRLFINTL